MRASYMEVVLYGTLISRENAKGIIENHPCVKRVDSCEQCTLLRILLNRSVSEIELVSLLADSGLSGLRIKMLASGR